MLIKSKNLVEGPFVLYNLTYQKGKNVQQFNSNKIRSFVFIIK